MCVPHITTKKLHIILLRSFFTSDKEKKDCFAYARLLVYVGKISSKQLLTILVKLFEQEQVD